MTPSPDPQTTASTPARKRRAACSDDAQAHLIDPAAVSDTERIARTLAEAFTKYPFTDWTVPAQDRQRRLRGLFSLTIASVGIPYGDVFVARCERCPQAADIVGAVVGVPHNGVPAQAWTSMAAAEQALLGDRAEVSAQASDATNSLRPSSPHYTIATIGVVSHHQRRGLAHALLEPVLARADEQALPAYLETSSHLNVRLYQSVGFAVLDTIKLPDDGPTVWGMLRPEVSEVP